MLLYTLDLQALSGGNLAERITAGACDLALDTARLNKTDMLIHSRTIMHRARLKAVTLAAALITMPAVHSAHGQLPQADDPRIKAFEDNIFSGRDEDQGQPSPQSIADSLLDRRVPGASVAIIEDGRIIWSKGYGTKLVGSGEAVDADTVFSVGSVSKMINAALILRLVAEGLLDLDEDVNTYLTSWKVPDSPYTTERKVTLRTILSHTAGFSQHGFADFQPGEALPTAIQTLNGERPAKHPPVRLMFEPGERMDYSGGGITVSQVLVEDVTGLSYGEAARRYVFEPLGMTRSTFANPLPKEHGNIARAHGEHNNPTGLPRGWEAMPELAASGLWTSANDLALFVIALLGKGDRPDAFLPPDLLADMMTRVPQSWHGLGPRLNGAGQTRVFHHGGANNSYMSWIEGHLHSGNGIVILTNSAVGWRARRNIRQAGEDAFNWLVKSEDGFEEPEF